jgi:hypothetical protein
MAREIAKNVRPENVHSELMLHASVVCLFSGFDFT